MSAANTCSQCGKPIPSDAPKGICPNCLLQAGASVGEGESASGSRPEPLPVEEVARLFPEIEILGLLGAGGMGAVYKARQPKLDRLVALKILDRQGRDPRFVERFGREARTLARLNHPNIVAVHEFGEREGLFFLVLELVDGVSLRDLLRDGKMPPKQALAIVPSICEALQYAHDKGVVHRDIKPENILVDKEGRVKVADFGIAKFAAAPEDDPHLTGDADRIGTVHYMAPEQVENPREVDHRADIYALGVVFYEMLTGELTLGKFPEPSKQVEVDVRLDEVVLKALEKEPARRYQQASEVKTRVETIAGSSGKTVKPGSPATNEEVRKQVFAPAVGLMVAAALTAVAMAPAIVASLTAPVPVAVITVLVLAPAVVAIVWGAFRMMRLGSYRWAVAASVIAMVVPPGFIIGLPVGVWSLWVLSRRNVREAFAGRGRRDVLPLPKCPACIGQVSASAWTCPHCGHPLWTENIPQLRRAFVERAKASRSVAAFCVAAVLVSAIAWFSDSGIRLFALAPLGSDSYGPRPIALITYGFVHSQPFHLISNIFFLYICGLILEPRIGSRTTSFIILGGILFPGILWMTLGEGGVLIGSTGIMYAMAGGLLALWHRHRSRLILPERIVIGIFLALAALDVVGAIFPPRTTWVFVTGIPVGYGIALWFHPIIQRLRANGEQATSIIRPR